MKPEVMPKEICCRNYQLLFSYIELTEGFPSGLSGKAAVDKVLEGLAGNPEFLIQDPDDQHLSYPVNQSHLQNPRYWVSYDFGLRILENSANVIGGYRPLYRAGVVCGYRTLLVSQPKHFQIFRLLSPANLVRFVKYFTRRFNSIKTPSILEYRPGFVRIKLGYGEKFKTRVTKDLCDWNEGVYTGHGILTGSFNVKIRETECCVFGDDDCIFEITWSYYRFWRRLLIFLHSMLDPNYIMGRDLDNLLLHDSILRQEGIINDKTAKLEQAHEQLRETDRLMTEAHIAGGMAHEIRNALGAAKLRISKTHTYCPLEENNQHLLELFRQASGRENITQEEKKKILSHTHALKKHLDSFGKTIDEISEAIERGLSVANRVMNYALLHQEAAPQFVDIQSTLKSLRETYLESFQELGIEIDVDIEQNIKIQAAADQFYSIFQNLLLNARDAIEEAEKSGGKIVIRSRLHSTDVVIEVIDNGAGIDEEQKNKIFQPFYSTKPSKGMGLGLNECQKILRNLNGRMEVQSIRGEGTTFRIVFQFGVIVEKDGISGENIPEENQNNSRNTAVV